MSKARLQARDAALAAELRRLREVAATLKEREQALDLQAVELRRRESAVARALEAPESSPDHPRSNAAGGAESRPKLMLEPPLRNMRTVLTRTMKLGVPVDGRVVWVRQVGGTTLVVGIDDGQQIRITARRNPATQQYESSYEATSPLFAEGTGSLVWETTSHYQPCQSEKLEECLQSALSEVSGTGLSSVAHDEAPMDAPAPEQAPAEEILEAPVAQEILDTIRFLAPGEDEPRSDQDWVTTTLSAIQRVRRLYPEVDQARSGPEWLRIARAALRRELPRPTP